MVAAETRRGEWDSRLLTMLVREFIRAALRQPAIADFVGEYIFDIATSGDEAPAGIGDGLRLAIYEALDAATSEDWEQVASDLLTYARECIKDGDAAAASPSAAPAMEGWAPPPAAMRSPRRRKPPVRVEPSKILVWLTERGSATTREIAQHFSISEGTAWRNADVLVYQGKLKVTPGEMGWDGRPRVYSIPAAPPR